MTIKFGRGNFADMKRILLILAAVVVGGAVSVTVADESVQMVANDSIMNGSLTEITVEAVNQISKSDKTVFIPTGRQRTAASDGVSLLGLMNIPQLDVNRLAGTVKTAANQPVDLFINYHAASKEEVAGLNPANVRRVEYLEFPVDPRFLRARYVVNFIVKAPAYGGYTKFSAKERFLVNSGSASAYSKFSYKCMEYDLMAAVDYDNGGHRGEDARDVFNIRGNDIVRDSRILGGRFRETDVFAGFGAMWNKSQRFTWRNMLTLNADRNPENQKYGIVDIPQYGQNDTYRLHSNSTNGSLGLNSELYADFGEGWSLENSLVGEFNRNRTSSLYSTSENSIANGAYERGCFFKNVLQLNKNLSEKAGVFTNLVFGGGHTLIDYSGSSDARNRFTPLFGGATLGAMLSTEKISGSIDGGYVVESSTINGSTVRDAYPFTHVNLQYAANEKNSVGLWFQYAAMSADAAMKNPNVIQENELMYISGNPDLHCAKHISANVSYTWLADNRFQMTAYASMFRITNRQVPVYKPDGPGGMMLKKYYNDGNYNHGQIGARLSGKFMGGKLAVSFAPCLLMYHTTGENKISHYPLRADLSVDYYLKSFYFNVLWYSSLSYVDGETCYRRDLPTEYSLSAGWAAKGWNIELALVNIFRGSWLVSDDVLRSKWFDSRVTRYGADRHGRISVSVSYTFNYGRKVERRDALSNQGGGSSSILR